MRSDEDDGPWQPFRCCRPMCPNKSRDYTITVVIVGLCSEVSMSIGAEEVCTAHDRLSARHEGSGISRSRISILCRSILNAVVAAVVATCELVGSCKVSRELTIISRCGPQHREPVIPQLSTMTKLLRNAMTLQPKPHEAKWSEFQLDTEPVFNVQHSVKRYRRQLTLQNVHGICAGGYALL